MSGVKLNRQESLLILALRQGDMFGCHMRELNAICYRYGARLYEMGQRGFVFDTVRLGKGEFQYYLRREPGEVELWRDKTHIPTPSMADLTAGRTGV